MNARHDAAAAALLTPAWVKIGPFLARPFSGGDMLIAARMGLILAGGDAEKIAGMTPADQTAELLQMGALLCHAPEELKGALWKGDGDGLRERFVEPVLFKLSPTETQELVEHVAKFFHQANEVAVKIEDQPRQGPVPEPQGNG